MTYMGNDLVLEGQKYISAKRAAELTGYTSDYIGQLSRGGKLPSQIIGRARYVEEKALLNYYKSAHGIEDSDDEKSAQPTESTEAIKTEIDTTYGSDVVESFSENFEEEIPGIDIQKLKDTDSDKERDDRKDKIIPFSQALTTPISRSLMLKAGVFGFAVALIFSQTILQSEVVENLVDTSSFVFFETGERVITVFSDVGVAANNFVKTTLTRILKTEPLASLDTYESATFANVVGSKSVRKHETPLRWSLRFALSFPLQTLHGGFLGILSMYTDAANFWRSTFLNSIGKTADRHSRVWDDLYTGYKVSGQSAADTLSGSSLFAREGVMASVVLGAKISATSVYNTLCDATSVCKN